MAELSRNELIKEASAYLRGTLHEGLSDEITGAIVEDDQQLVKFHGMYPVSYTHLTLPTTERV